MATPPNFPRIVIDHARYWRGVAHVWSTTYFFGGGDWDPGEAATVGSNIAAAETECLFPGPANSGGFIETRGYNAALGAPVYVNAYGNIDTPSTWEAYSGTAWGAVSDPIYDTAAEACFYLETPLAGLSTTGKPVKSVKYMHSVPVIEGSGGPGDGIPANVITAISTAFAFLNSGTGPNNRRMISNGGRFPSGPPTVRPYIGNHQMPQGRRKKKSAGGVTLTASLVKDLSAIAAAAEDALPFL